MELLIKPPKTKLVTAAEEYFNRHVNAMTVGFISKEGKEFWFKRDPRTGDAVKITRQEAGQL